METIKINNISVDIERKNIKHVHLSVYPPDGRVHISVPSRMSIENVNLYLLSKFVWINNSVTKVVSYSRQTQREYVSGESHYLKGQRYLLRVIYLDAKPKVVVKDKTFIDMYVRPNATLETRAKVMKEWYREEMKNLLSDYVAKWEERIQLECSGWDIKQMKTKWGTCNTRTKHITFNLELAKKPINCIEYIVVHELAHLLVHNHNEQFKFLLDTYLPQWRTYKQELNEFIV
jgi:predicted metal-dependent hydrolase